MFIVYYAKDFFLNYLIVPLMCQFVNVWIILQPTFYGKCLFKSMCNPELFYILIFSITNENGLIHSNCPSYEYE